MSVRIVALLLLLASGLHADALQGKVVEDHSGNPLASAEIKVRPVGAQQLAADLETDSTGRFSVDRLPPGKYRIEASKPNYAGAMLEVSKLASDLQIRLVRLGAIAGQVLDAQGKPVLGAEVYAIPKPSGGGPLKPFDPATISTRVSDRGLYRLTNLAPGEYVLAVTYGASTSIFGSSGGASVRPGLGSGILFYPSNTKPQTFAIAGGEDYRNTNFTILSGVLFTVSGKVELPDPKTRFWLALILEEQPVLANAVAETKEDGSFQFEGVASGIYALVVSGPMGGYGGKGIFRGEPLFARTQVSVSGSNVDGVALSMRKGRSLSFLLTAAGGQKPDAQCPSTAHLNLMPVEDWATRLETSGEIDFAKEKMLDGLGPAKFQAELTGLGDSCYQVAPVVVDLSSGNLEGPVRVPVAAGGTIQGKLTGANMPSEFAVALVPGDATAGAQSVRVAFPDATGKFTFASLRPGVYRIAAHRSNDSKLRWVSDRSRMLEVQITAGSATVLELPAPKPGAEGQEE